ncbi:serine/arginine repetitive matrix protein 1-like [Drosophila eugracilis]|uniref:serine/arginine repetitive matrix protein 1-like n=1 Tax=Drosophila eugracilis TaxID=29029 RepID=UPI001BDA4082|nr:serine/arginine repetitive matrix protein 1-like [Drosophila eugracilis]
MLWYRDSFTQIRRFRLRYTVSLTLPCEHMERASTLALNLLKLRLSESPLAFAAGQHRTRNITPATIAPQHHARPQHHHALGTSRSQRNHNRQSQHYTGRANITSTEPKNAHDHTTCRRRSKAREKRTTTVRTKTAKGPLPRSAAEKGLEQLPPPADRRVGFETNASPLLHPSQDYQGYTSFREPTHRRPCTPARTIKDTHPSRKPTHRRSCTPAGTHNNYMGVSWVSYRKKHELEAILLELGLEQNGTVDKQRARLYAFARQTEHSEDTLIRLGEMERKYGNAPSGDTKPPSPLPPSHEKGLSSSHTLTIPRSTSPSPETRGKSEGTVRTGAHQYDAGICSMLIDKVSKWGLSLDGTSDPLSFIEHIEERADTHRIDREYLSHAIIVLLTGQAENWFRTSDLRRPPHRRIHRSPHRLILQPPHRRIHHPPHRRIHRSPHRRNHQPQHRRIHHPPYRRIHRRIHQPPQGRIYKPPHRRIHQPPHRRTRKPPPKRIHKPPHRRIHKPPHRRTHRSPHRRIHHPPHRRIHRSPHHPQGASEAHPQAHLSPHRRIHQPPHRRIHHPPHRRTHHPPLRRTHRSPHRRIHKPHHRRIHKPPHRRTHRSLHRRIHQPPHRRNHHPPHPSVTSVGTIASPPLHSSQDYQGYSSFKETNASPLVHTSQDTQQLHGCLLGFLQEKARTRGYSSSVTSQTHPPAAAQTHPSPAAQTHPSPASQAHPPVTSQTHPQAAS